MSRPGLTRDGLVFSFPSGNTFLDGLIFDFDIDSFRLKPKHERFLDEVITFCKRPDRGNLTVSIDGFASRTGGAQHNESLSADREQSVEGFLRTRTRIFDEGSPHRINRQFHGFRDSPPGEHAKFRSVRIVVHSPDRPPLPVPIPLTDEDDSTLFEIRRVEFSSDGIFFVLRDTVKVKITKIVDRDHRQEALFVYQGGGLTLDIFSFLNLPSGAFGINQTSRPIAFHTSRPLAQLDDFEGDASLGHSGLEQKVLFLTISSGRLTHKGIFVRERPIQLPNPGSVDTSLLTPTDGTLRRTSAITSPSHPFG